MKWTPTMYRLLAFMTFDEVFGSCLSWTSEDSQRIKLTIRKHTSRLNSNQLNFVKFRVRQAKNNYKANLLENFQDMYYKEIDRGEDLYPPIEFDQNVYDVWTQAVRLRKSVNMQYSSTTSGITTRIVDPYKTKTPYGIGFCHSKNEERKFRFDRIIEISLTENAFIKPKTNNGRR